MAEITTISKDERDRLLDEVAKETRRWAQDERKRIEEKADFLKKVLKARAGSGKVSASNIERISKITAKSINNLLGIQVAATKKS
jgi:hypothetical protein